MHYDCGTTSNCTSYTTSIIYLVHCLRRMVFFVGEGTRPPAPAGSCCKVRLVVVVFWGDPTNTCLTFLVAGAVVGVVVVIDSSEANLGACFVFWGCFFLLSGIFFFFFILVFFLSLRILASNKLTSKGRGILLLRTNSCCSFLHGPAGGCS